LAQIFTTGVDIADKCVKVRG